MSRAVNDATKTDSMPKSNTFHKCIMYSRGPSAQTSLHSVQIIPVQGNQRKDIKPNRFHFGGGLTETCGNKNLEYIAIDIFKKYEIYIHIHMYTYT